MSHLFMILNQSDYLIQTVDINSDTKWQTVQIQISWLQKPTNLDLVLQKPTDLDLVLFATLRKHTYSNVLKILQPNKGKFSD